MEANNENIEKLKKDYAVTYRNLQILKKDKTNAEAADIERRCLFTKYMICKLDTNEDVAGALLKNELNSYTNLIDDQNGLNNYWNQFDCLNINTDNDPSDWKSDLIDPNLGLQFFETLPCNTNNTLCCKYKEHTDRDVEKMIDLWKNGGTSPGARKVPQGETKIFNKQNKETKCTSFPKQNSIPERININKPQEDKFISFPKQNPIPERININKPQEDKFISFPKQNNVPERININKSQEDKFISFPKQNSVPERINMNKQQKFIKNEPRQTERREQPNQKQISSFKTAREVAHQSVNNRPPVKKSLGGRALNSPFVCPFKDEQPPKEEKVIEPIDERLKNIEPKMIELIRNEIMDSGSPISWDDIAGLEQAKKIIKEIVVFPMLRPDIFTGLRRPPKGILLFGPPGTGKTLIGKCIASQSKSTFFSISASSLTSKWIGEGEKMVRALFAVAQVEQPSVVFIDEIDSLLCQRSETEHESSRRMKTEFLVQLDGAATGDEDRILVIGATNRPYELDEAARRRLVKRLYIPLPEMEARAQIILNLLKTERNNLTNQEICEIARSAAGYSGADMTNLCKEASMGPIRNIPFDQLENINMEDVREVTFNDFKKALDTIRPSVSQKDLSVYIEWNCTYGTTNTQSYV